MRVKCVMMRINRAMMGWRGFATAASIDAKAGEATQHHGYISAGCASSKGSFQAELMLEQ